MGQVNLEIQELVEAFDVLQHGDWFASVVNNDVVGESAAGGKVKKLEKSPK